VPARRRWAERRSARAIALGDGSPTGARLTAYKRDAADLPPRTLQDFLDAVAAGTAAVPIGHVYQFDQIVEARTDVEQNRASGKLVVTT
jgi:NADPH:quinone reductase